MRQPGTEFNIDPYKVIGTAPIPAPEIPASFEKDHQKWQFNTAVSKQHKYCANLCVNFKSGSSLSQ
jgi:hypothetical protein